MTRDQHGLAARLQRQNQVLDLLAAERVKPGGRFVENQEFGVVDHRLRQADPARHALRVLADAAAAGMRHPDHVEQLIDPLFAIGARQVEERPEKVERLLGGQVFVQIRLLRQIADLPLGLHRAGRATEHVQNAAGRIEQAQQHLDRGRLAGAVRPQKPDHLSGFDGERDVIHRLRLRAAPEIPEHFGKPYGPHD